MRLQRMTIFFSLFVSVYIFGRQIMKAFTLYESVFKGLTYFNYRVIIKYKIKGVDIMKKYYIAIIYADYTCEVLENCYDSEEEAREALNSYPENTEEYEYTIYETE